MSKKASVSADSAQSLLYPIVAFLLAGGLSKAATHKAVTSVIEQAERRGGRRIEYIGQPIHFADVLNRWSHDPRFMDREGRPRALLVRGKNGFGALLRTITPTLNARAVLAVLSRYGNVRKVRGGRYALIRPYFLSSTRHSMAFEPVAVFLSDASTTLGRMLKRTKASRGPEPFWRKVETTGLSAAAAAEFSEFVRHRSLDFLEELDDWLEARRGEARKRSSPRKGRRVGIGLFSIYSEPEVRPPG
jgi:hypothetical protein